MTEPLALDFEDGSSLRLVHKPGGCIVLEARSALGPTVTAIELNLTQVEAVRKWLGKHDAARRAEGARAAIWELTVPHPSEVSFKLLEFLLAAAKDIASVKDVDTGNTPTTAPVGTTLAVQAQALQVFSAIYKRIYRGEASDHPRLG